MRLISFDVGIKNMAYCIFDIDTNKVFSMIDWNIMNLMNESNTIIHTCSCHLKPKSKKNIGSPSPCKSKAKYTKNGKYYCDKHAKTCEFLPYSKACSQPSLKKMKVDMLIQKYKECFPLHNITNLPMTKVSMLRTFDEKMLEQISKPKEKSASETDLITIGKNMSVLLDTIPNLDMITHVIIENQISPLANRMKTIQGMLAQYFIIKGSPTLVIEFVSSFNKLKDFTKAGDVSDYKQHKKDSIIICQRFLDNNENLTKWKDSAHFISLTKRDDLADCFLQGIWYMKNKKNIVYNGALCICSSSIDFDERSSSTSTDDLGFTAPPVPVKPSQSEPIQNLDSLPRISEGNPTPNENLNITSV